MRKFRHLTLAGLFGLSTFTTAQAGTLVDLSAEAIRPAANDEIHAMVYTEATGNNPAELAKRVNQSLA